MTQGSVVENLSNGKLATILFSILAAQIFFFFIGAVVSPAPSSTMNFLMTMCRDASGGKTDRWFYLRPGSAGCQVVEKLAPPYKAEDIVFVAQMPHIRDNRQLEYSPWFQSILTLMVVDTQFFGDKSSLSEGRYPDIIMDVRLGYQDKGDTKWKELTKGTVQRELKCHPDMELLDTKGTSAHYDCEPMDLFEMGSSDHPFYLLNIRIPECNETRGRANCDIGRLREIHIVEIHQNGGFTQVWLSLKTMLFPIVLWFVVWYWKRINLLPRAPYLLEKSILALGVSMVLIDLPIEWFSLWMSMPWMLLVGDIRQGLFYVVLASFWMIYAGEHLTSDTSKHDLGWYWKRLASVITACLCMFVYDMCERGVRLRDPFYSIWSTRTGTNLAYGFIVLAAISSLVYFLYMVGLLVRVWLNIKRKRVDLMQMTEGRRIRFQGIIYRLKFLMFLTGICIALTVAAAMMERIGEGQLHWGDYEEAPMVNYSSSFLTGVFGMWNLYVLLLLWMYAPSHKRSHVQIQDDADSDELLMDSHNNQQSEVISLNQRPDGNNRATNFSSNPLNAPTETSDLATLVKPNLD